MLSWATGAVVKKATLLPFTGSEGRGLNTVGTICTSLLTPLAASMTARTFSRDASGSSAIVTTITSLVSSR